MSVAEGRAFVVSLQEAGLSPSSFAGFVRGLRPFSAWCAAEGLVAEDPLRRLPRPQVPSRLIGTLGPLELERLLAVASRRDRLIIALLLDTGLRLSELAGLRIGDLLPDGYLRVRGKGGKERLVPLGSVTEARLPDYLAHSRPRPIGRDVDHVFLARDGRPLTSAAIQHAASPRASAGCGRAAGRASAGRRRAAGSGSRRCAGTCAMMEACPSAPLSNAARKTSAR